MNTLITAIALASALVAGTAAAASNNVQLDQLGGGTAIESGSYYDSKEQVNIDEANLPSNSYGTDLYGGSK